MEKIVKVLFPTDFSKCAENAFAYALQFVPKLGAQIEVLHVVYPVTESLDYPVLVNQATQARVEGTIEVLQAFTKLGMAKVKDEVDGKIYAIQDIEVGAPVRTINHIALRDSMDMIIMGTKGTRKGFDRWFGSVASGVVEDAHCPVMVIPDDAVFKGINSVIYATDLKKADPFEIWKATKWLAPFGVTIHCTHCNLNKENEEINLNELQDFFADHAPGLQIKFHHISGTEFVETMNDFVEEMDADMLVMFQPQRNFLERIFHKSQTKKMAYNNQVPLLVLK